MSEGKTSNFQGGIRVNAFVSGGLIPAPMRGKRLNGLGAVWDWYATFAELAGVDPTDHMAAAAGLPGVDSVSLWPYLSGANQTSPRKALPIGSTSCSDGYVYMHVLLCMSLHVYMCMCLYPIP